MLWDDDRSLMLVGDGQSAWGNQRFRLNVVLLHARTGVATGRELASPGVESSDETEGSRRRSVVVIVDGKHFKKEGAAFLRVKPDLTQNELLVADHPFPIHDAKALEKLQKPWLRAQHADHLLS